VFACGCRALRLERARERNAAERLRAVVCLQAWARGWQARCYYHRLQHDMEAVGKLVEERLAAEAYRVEGQVDLETAILNRRTERYFLQAFTIPLIEEAIFVSFCEIENLRRGGLPSSGKLTRGHCLCKLTGRRRRTSRTCRRRYGKARPCCARAAAPHVAAAAVVLAGSSQAARAAPAAVVVAVAAAPHEEVYPRRPLLRGSQRQRQRRSQRLR
jgi:hypothetical protein